jgi:hypothetical protein
MATYTKRFHVYPPGTPGRYEELFMDLSRVLGERPLQRDARGRHFVTLPAPYESIAIRDGETLTAKKYQRLIAALEALKHGRFRLGKTP